MIIPSLALLTALTSHAAAEQAKPAMCDRQIGEMVAAMEAGLRSAQHAGILSKLDSLLKRTLPLTGCSVDTALQAFSASSLVSTKDDMGRYFAVELRKGSVVTGLAIYKDGTLKSGYVKVDN